MKTDLATQIISGDRKSVADALNLIDDQRPHQQTKALQLLRALSGVPEKPRIGITGPPGVGKSTMISAISAILAERGLTVGIIAVDPSSRRTGGAFLGDRIRMRTHSNSPRPFFRSMAARNRLGGISDATYAGVTILEASFDCVLVETVGVGQSEGEIRTLVDTLVYICQPSSGDLIQFMKAGILELPDIFVINKCDIGSFASRSAEELRSGVGLTTSLGDEWKPPVLLTSAQTSSGIREVCEALEDHKRFLGSGAGVLRRRDSRDQFIRRQVLTKYGTLGLQALGGDLRLREFCTKWETLSPYEPLMHLEVKIGRLLKSRLNQPDDPLDSNSL